MNKIQYHHYITQIPVTVTLPDHSYHIQIKLQLNYTNQPEELSENKSGITRFSQFLLTPSQHSPRAKE